MTSVGWMPMPKKRSQPVLPVLSLTPNGISSSRNTTLNTHSSSHLSARMSMSRTVMTTNAKIPRNSDAVCTITYFGEPYDAVALEITTMPNTAQRMAITSKNMSARRKNSFAAAVIFFTDGLLSAPSARIHG